MIEACIRYRITYCEEPPDGIPAHIPTSKHLQNSLQFQEASRVDQSAPARSPPFSKGKNTVITCLEQGLGSLQLINPLAPNGNLTCGSTQGLIDPQLGSSSRDSVRQRALRGLSGWATFGWITKTSRGSSGSKTSVRMHGTRGPVTKAFATCKLQNLKLLRRGISQRTLPENIHPPFSRKKPSPDPPSISP